MKPPPDRRQAEARKEANHPGKVWLVRGSGVSERLSAIHAHSWIRCKSWCYYHIIILQQCGSWYPLRWQCALVNIMARFTEPNTGVTRSPSAPSDVEPRNVYARCAHRLIMIYTAPEAPVRDLLNDRTFVSTGTVSALTAALALLGPNHLPGLYITFRRAASSFQMPLMDV
jgi:hypothetical protein